MNFLEEYGVNPSIVEQILQHKFTFDTFLNLTDETLKHIGIQLWEDRSTFLDGISLYKQTRKLSQKRSLETSKEVEDDGVNNGTYRKSILLHKSLI